MLSAVSSFHGALLIQLNRREIMKSQSGQGSQHPEQQHQSVNGLLVLFIIPKTFSVVTWRALKEGPLFLLKSVYMDCTAENDVMLTEEERLYEK